MDGTIASQLQAIKSQLRGPTADTTVRTNRPITRPSVLFDPKQAADIDLRTILPIAVSGLDVLVGLDSRFERYKDSIFSAASLDVDREKMVPNEEKKIDKSISSYLRLLAGHLQLPAALKTLEYLIRRYQIHVYNVDELVLCALPYHDTHAFVRIVQLIDLKSKIWGFLEGSRVSGAPPPRKVIVQQCIRDKGVLEALCNHASPTNEFCHSRPVICFCTAVVVEALGSVQKLDDETVKRVLPFVFNGLNPAMNGSQDAKAGALMVVGLLASRATLASKLIQNLIFFIVRVAHQDAKESADLPWLRVTLMAIITIVQSQSVNTFFEKSLKLLVDTRDISGILAGLSKDFNIEKFLSLYLQTLVDYSSSDDTCCSALTTMLEVIPAKKFIGNIVPKVLKSCLKLSQGMEENLQESGGWAKQIFIVIDKHYKSELCAAMENFFQNSKQYSMKEERVFKTLHLMLDGSLEMPSETSDSKFWFSLQHPKARFRQTTLSHLSSSGLLKAKPLDPRLLVIVRDTIIRQLRDEDLTVVQATLSMQELSGLFDSPSLLRAIRDVLSRCIVILKAGAKNSKAACEVAALCLRTASQLNHSKGISTLLFPLLIILPKTWRVNLTAFELAKATQWPFYGDKFSSINIPLEESSKTPEHDSITALNLKTVEVLAESFVQNPGEYIEWLIECSKSFEPSKSLFLLIMLQSVFGYKGDICGLLRLSEVCFPVLKDELHDMASKGNIFLSEEFTTEKLDNSLLGCISSLLSSNVEVLNAKIVVCICWAFLEAFASMAPDNAQADECKQLSIFENLFIFFTSSLKDVFKEHILFLLTKCYISPVEFLSRFFTVEGFPVVVQVESLLWFATLCSTTAPTDMNTMNTNKALEFLVGFPSLLVPLSHKRKDIRTAAMNCIEALYNLWTHFDGSRVKNGNDALLIRYVSTPIFGKLLALINEQKKLILSDMNFLPSLLTSMLGHGSDNLVVPQNIEKRFDQQAKDTILLFILNLALKLSSYAKLMVLSLFEGIGNSILQVDEVKLFLSELMERRSHHHCGFTQKSLNKLSETEIEILCTLLKTSVVVKTSANIGSSGFDYLIRAIKVDGSSLEDPAVVKPCVTALQSVTSTWYNSLESEKQDEIFGNLAILFRNDNGSIQRATKQALLQINVSHLSVVKLLEAIISKGHEAGALNRMKRKKLHSHRNFCFGDLLNSGEKMLLVINSLLDILLLQKDIERRKFFVEPLFQLLRELFSEKWLQMITGTVKEGTGSSPRNHRTVTDAITDAQQATLTVLEDISTSLISDISSKDEIFNKENVKLLAECARSAENVVTRNHVFLLLAAIAKISSVYVSECIPDLLTVIGEAIVKQNDSQSQRVLEDLISTLVPCWLSKIDGVKNLLQVFTNVLQQVVEHRRLTLMVYLLRTLGKKSSLGTFLALLFRSLTLRKSRSSDYEGCLSDTSHSNFICREWEYLFAEEISSQFSCIIWLPCLIILLEEMGFDDQHEEHHYELLLVLHFISQKLQDTELIYELESGQEISYLQCMLGALMEKVVLQQLFGRTRCVLSFVFRKQLKEIEFRLLKTITDIMWPSEYYKGITRLLGYADVNVRKKTLGFLCKTAKNNKLVSRKHRQKNKHLDVHMDEATKESFCGMCLKLIQFVDVCGGDDSSTAVMLSVVSCLEVLANEFPFYDSIFMASLTAIVKHITSTDLQISSSCLRCASALINILGSKALPELPNITNSILGRAHDFSICPSGKHKDGNYKALDSRSTCKMPLSLSVLMTLEAIVGHLGCFLNPYLDGIIKLLVLNPEYVSESDPRVKSKAAVVRKLVIEKIPVRLTLTPLLKIYPEALDADKASLSLYFEMLTTAIDSMDRSSIGFYHLRIFEQCLLALDLRHQCKKSVKRINVVEQNVIHAIVVLTKKLTESMFRPLFLLSLEWAEAEIVDDSTVDMSIERNISFYNLVNKLAEQHRSLFVPYFKHLIDGCLRYLTDNSSSLTQKRKKAKTGEECELEGKGSLKPKQWHLRALILASLHKCFLYDTGNLKFLDSSNFQILLKPIVSQLVAEPPVLQEHLSDVPAIEEVDKSLVSCLGQMAVAVGSDDIWKQLNHEVLMQTRSEKIRPRILGLKVVKYLMEHLKEEYLVLLPETIPFLGELLEDLELPVKSLAQEIFKELESLSGENLRQYL